MVHWPKGGVLCESVTSALLCGAGPHPPLHPGGGAPVHHSAQPEPRHRPAGVGAGVPLFERSGRNTTLTRLGEEFLVCAERTLSTLDSGVESLRRSAQGEGLIRLGWCAPWGWTSYPTWPPASWRRIQGKRSTSPSGTGVTQQLLDGLLARRYDLVFSSMPPGRSWG